MGFARSADSTASFRLRVRSGRQNPRDAERASFGRGPHPSLRGRCGSGPRRCVERCAPREARGASQAELPAPTPPAACHVEAREPVMLHQRTRRSKNAQIASVFRPPAIVPKPNASHAHCGVVAARFSTVRWTMRAEHLHQPSRRRSALTFPANSRHRFPLGRKGSSWARRITCRRGRERLQERLECPFR